MTYTTPKLAVLGRIHALTLDHDPNHTGCDNSASGKPCGTIDGLSNITGKPNGGFS